MVRAIVATILLCLFAWAALARDNGQWAQADPAISEWFKSLKTPGGGLCCDFADGSRVDDPSWDCTDDEHCRVNLEGVWYEVDPDKIVRASNRIGYAVVWRYMSDGKAVIRCFMPGARS